MPSYIHDNSRLFSLAWIAGTHGVSYANLRDIALSLQLVPAFQIDAVDYFNTGQVEQILAVVAAHHRAG